jgi:DNA-binding LacI/PurR family transcriptional regulator
MASGYEAFVDGFIVYGPPQPAKLAQLLSQHKSIITVDFEIEGHVSVNVDNYKGARICAEHALEGLAEDDEIAVLGLRINDRNRVCLVDVGGLFDESTITIQRLSGFQSAAKKMGRNIVPKKIWHVPDNTHKLGYQAAREALSTQNHPKVLLCMSDRIALGALQAARHLGIRVPEDVKITGFDDIPESHIQHPTLTTVHQQCKDKGRIAAEIFLGMREEKSLVLPTELIIRESCP